MQNIETPRPLASDGRDAIVKKFSELVTGGQIRTIRDLSGKVKLNNSEISQKIFGCNCDELSISGADDVIAHLRKLQPKGSRNILPFIKTEKESSKIINDASQS